MTMPAKIKPGIVLLLITVAAGIFCACGNSAPETPPTSETVSAGPDRVEVVYFHRAQRCKSCVYAETGTRYVLETYFKGEVASGKVVFKSVNIDDKENAAAVQKYGAFASSLFINTLTGGTDHIEEVKQIWFIVGNDKAFTDIVKAEIEESLKRINNGPG